MKQISRLRPKYKSFSFGVLLYIAVKDLASKKLRTLLTILGVTIGIGAIFFLLSAGLGLQNLVSNELVGNKSVKTIDVTSANSEIVRLNSDAAQRISDLPHVDKLGVSFSAPGIIKFEGSESSGPIYGLDEGYQDLSNLNLVAGRLINDNDNDSALVSLAKLKAMGLDEPSQLINKSIELSTPYKDKTGEQQDSTQELTVIGIIDIGSESVVYVPNIVFAPTKIAEYSQIKLSADDTKNVSELRKQIESIGYETTSPADTLDQINQIFKYFNLALIGFGAIGMIVAVLGMFNTLTISLLERTKEIGLMLALGSRPKDMRKLFIIEAILLSIIGSIIGICTAILTSQIVNIFVNYSANSRGVTERLNLFSTPLWLVLALIIFMTLIGLIVVLLPARRAERINPIDAIRRE